MLHDDRNPDRSVAIVGDVTGRAVGSPMSEIGLSLLRQGNDAKDKFNYVVRLPDGRLMKSSTTLLRTSTGDVVGALCINSDVTQLHQLIAEFTQDTRPPTPPKPSSATTSTTSSTPH